MITKLFEFIHKERLYFLLIVFILVVNAIVANLENEPSVKSGQGEEAGAEFKAEEKVVKEAEDIFMKREVVERLLSENKGLALIVSLTTLLMLVLFLLGILLDIVILSTRMSGGPINISTFPLSSAGWTITDVGKVVVLFMFFGHVIVICDSFLFTVFPVLKNDNFRMMANSSILDIQAVVFIIYFTVIKNGEKLRSLGLSFKNFFRNVFYGLTGYIAAIPALVAALLLIILIVKITKYVPEKQPVVELFMKEKSAAFLFFSSLFAAVVGPIIEEIFFRGFMYKAFKNRIGLVRAALLTSVVFAALHTNLVGFLPIFMLGLLLVYLYEKTGTLVASMTVHVVHNLGMVFFVFLLKQLKG